MKRVRILMAVAAAAMAAGPLSRSPSPTDRLQGEFTRIVNIHAPSMWVAFLAFGVTALASILWLVRKTDRWDRIAEASVETGVLFTATGLFTGMVWGQAVWGRAWDWADPRMASTAVMFFVYLGYLALRRATPDPVMRARRSAILGAIAVVRSRSCTSQSICSVPSIRRSRSGPDGATMPDEMVIALLVNFLAFTLLYVALTAARVEVAKAEDASRARPSRPGDAVATPLLSEVEDV